MPRPHKCRLIAAQPPLNAFKPAGIPGRELESIELGLDELEALRLADLEGLYHDAAAERMGISRQTFGRLVESARHKVACALFQSKMLIFNGGPIIVEGTRTFECAKCTARFTKPFGTGRPDGCPTCQSRDFHRVVEDRGRGRRAGAAAESGMCRGRCRRRAGWSKLAQDSGSAPAPPCPGKSDVSPKENAE